MSKKFKVVILTRIYSDNEKKEKKKYICKKLKEIEVIFVPYYIDKNKIVNPRENILVDDYLINVSKWIESGGIGIHINQEKRIDKLLNQYLIN